MASNMNQIAAEIRGWRQAARLTQAELAQRSGISVDSIRKYEQGKVDPPYSRVLAIKEALQSKDSVATVEDSKRAPSVPKSETRRADPERNAAISVIDSGSGRVWFEIDLTPVLRVVNAMNVHIVTEADGDDLDPKALIEESVSERNPNH